MEEKNKHTIQYIKYTTIILLIFFVLSFLLIKKSVVIKIKPFAFVFSHGSYQYYNFSSYHILNLNNKGVLTFRFLNDLEKEGYKYVYLTACQTMNEDYIYKTKNATILWNDYNMTIYKSKLFGNSNFLFRKV